MNGESGLEYSISRINQFSSVTILLKRELKRPLSSNRVEWCLIQLLTCSGQLGTVRTIPEAMTWRRTVNVQPMMSQCASVRYPIFKAQLEPDPASIERRTTDRCGSVAMLLS